MKKYGKALRTNVTPAHGLVLELPGHSGTRTRSTPKLYAGALYFEFAERADIDLISAGRRRGDGMVGDAAVHRAMGAALTGAGTDCFATASPCAHDSVSGNPKFEATGHGPEFVSTSPKGENL